MSEGGELTTSPEVPDVSEVSEVSEVANRSDRLPGGPAAGVDDAVATRFRLESEVRRLERELDLQQEAMRGLSARLRDAEREAATASGAVVDAMSAELTAWQDRARQAEAELAAIRGSALYRAAAPAMTLYRVRRRIPTLARKVLHRLG